MTFLDTGKHVLANLFAFRRAFDEAASKVVAQARVIELLTDDALEARDNQRLLAEFMKGHWERELERRNHPRWDEMLELNEKIRGIKE